MMNAPIRTTFTEMARTCTAWKAMLTVSICLLLAAILAISCGRGNPADEPWISESFLVMGGIEAWVSVPESERDDLPGFTRAASRLDVGLPRSGPG